MKKRMKIFSLILTAILCISGFSTPVFAANRPAARYRLPFELNVASYILVSLDTGEVIFEKDADRQRIPASLTKLMTSYVAFKYVEDLDNTMVTAKGSVFDELYGLNASTADIRKGETLSMRDLLYAMLLPSANEAAGMVADYIGKGSKSNFCMLMNTEAKKLGCTNTNFSNPSGLFTDNHYTSAYDLYLIAKACYETPGFMEIATQTIYQLPANEKHAAPYNILSTIRMQNKASPFYRSYVRGMKTGTLPEAGNCFVTMCEKNDEKYILVVLGAEYTDINGNATSVYPAFDATQQIMDYFFDSYSLKPANGLSTPAQEVKMRYCKEQDTLLLYPSAEIYSVLPNEVDETSFQKTYNVPEYVTAPIKAGQVIGSVSYYIAGSLVGTSDLVAQQDYQRNTFIYMVEKGKEILTSLYLKVVLVLVILLAALFMGYRYYIGKQYEKMRKVHRKR